MTDEQRKAIRDAQEARKVAKEAYDKEIARIDHLRKAWIAADLEVRRLLKSLNTTSTSVWHD